MSNLFEPNRFREETKEKGSEKLQLLKPSIDSSDTHYEVISGLILSATQAIIKPYKILLGAIRGLANVKTYGAEPLLNLQRDCKLKRERMMPIEIVSMGLRFTNLTPPALFPKASKLGTIFIKI